MTETTIPRPQGALATRLPRPAAGPTLVDWAHEHLLSMLMALEIAPGARIGIDAVARRLGISQTPIREALSRLEAERLVNKLANVGYRASGLMSRAEVHGLFELRLLIEPYAARRCAETIGDEGVRALVEVERSAHLLADDRGDGAGYARFASADAELHHLIAHETGNRFIAETVVGLRAHLHIFRLLYATEAPGASADEHARLLDAIVARDGAAAEAAMRDHLEKAVVRLDAALDRHEAARDDRAAPGL